MAIVALSVNTRSRESLINEKKSFSDFGNWNASMYPNVRTSDKFITSALRVAKVPYASGV